MLGSVCVYFDADAVLIAVGICAAVTLALTLFAFQVCSLYVLLRIDLVFISRKRILIQEKNDQYNDFSFRPKLILRIVVGCFVHYS